jgi:hypothetical protein
VTVLWVSTFDELASRFFASFISAIIIFDIVATHFAIAFVSRFPADPLRSVVFALTSFVQLAIAFGGLYASLGPSFTTGSSDVPFRIGALSSVYFSWLMMTTVGWADVVPHPHAALLKIIIALQLLVSLAFIVTVLQVMVGWSTVNPAEPPKRLIDLIKCDQ